MHSATQKRMIRAYRKCNAANMLGAAARLPLEAKPWRSGDKSFTCTNNKPCSELAKFNRRKVSQNSVCLLLAQLPMSSS